MLPAGALGVLLAVATLLRAPAASGPPARTTGLLPALTEEERAATRQEQQLRVFVHPLKVRPARNPEPSGCA